MSIGGYEGWPAYDIFLIMSISNRPIYDPNSLRPNLNLQKPVSCSCCVRRLGRTLIPLEFSKFCVFFGWCPFLVHGSMMQVIALTSIKLKKTKKKTNWIIERMHVVSMTVIAMRYQYIYQFKLLEYMKELWTTIQIPILTKWGEGFEHLASPLKTPKSVNWVKKCHRPLSAWYYIH